MRRIPFAINSYYHICNRSNDEKAIFLEEKDYARFLFLILFYQAPLSFFNIGRQTPYFVRHRRHRMFNIPALVLEKEEGGISRYLQRIQNGYAKYFNAKHRKRGHLFQGSFRAIPVETDKQLLYLSAYIHRNPRDLEEWRGKERTYPWSSYQDCIKKNRWGGLLKSNIFLNQFSTQKSYETFVETSTAKLRQGESPIKNLLLE